MPLTASAHSAGDTLRQDVLIDGRHHLVTDEPEHLGGTRPRSRAARARPPALAACIATTVRTYARTKQCPLSELTDVVYDHTSTRVTSTCQSTSRPTSFVTALSG